ncbi:MAG: macro domain-containing protein [Candidatus Omnitrophica bacterium]|nr:macro domain-containing protein [Candidatus Omnitrophota bacterium]MCM8822958.1 macro domain-containing protein [Candidatus Omnitrophota bacterium]MCM8825369.1 macro domain-containing protein [Candidatus Omnitrophota bacterium]MCM8828971.1 macro domain-containing protein [Candidatus Omnitrophota bacterium]
MVKIKNIELECVKGDITSQPDIDAIVNAANRFLAPGGGISGAIHRRAGPLLYQECKKYAPIETGQAVITGAYNLPNKFVIHTVGPVYSEEKNPAEKLAMCFKNSLIIADKNKVKSIAFPAISTGVFGYPVEQAAEVSMKTVIETIPQIKFIEKIRFVLFDEKTFNVFNQKIKEIYERKSDS